MLPRPVIHYRKNHEGAARTAPFAYQPVRAVNSRFPVITTSAGAEIYGRALFSLMGENNVNRLY